MKRKFFRKRLLVTICLGALFIITSFSPELVIRGNLLLRLHPIQSLTVDIDEQGYYDRQTDSYMFGVRGYKPYEWFVPEMWRGMSGSIWYLKKTDFGLYFIYQGAANP